MRPNIIFYFSDQQRADTLNDRVMPNLCRFLEQGVRFDNAFTCQPVCGPARACLQTGLYATENGCCVNNIPLPQHTKTLAEYLTDGGYDVAYVGKWHLASGNGHQHQKTAIPKDMRGGYNGFWRAADVLEYTSHGYDGYVFDENDTKIPFEGYRADAINGFAEEYLHSAPADKPFFLFVSQLEPHHQNDRHAFEGYKPTIADFKDYPIPSDLTWLEGDYRKAYPDYLSAINRLDYNLAHLVDTLRKQGLYDNTIIIYSSDHGCHFKTRNMEYKRTPHDSAIHVPLAAFGGYVEHMLHGKALTVEGLTSLIDIPVTILELAELDVPPHFSGKSILNLIKEPNTENHVGIFVQISESQIGRAIRTHDYMYAIRADRLGYMDGMTRYSARTYTEAYLYDMRNDPDQRTNLVKSLHYRDTRRALREQLVSEMLLAGETEPRIITPVRVRKK